MISWDTHTIMIGHNVQAGAGAGSKFKKKEGI